ncbi:MAG: VanZ family protein [Lachnospiraceae bacterium]|nr:VanZ family protein [Lachnospiraceae bacterium]
MQKKEKTRLIIFICYSVIMLVMLFARPITVNDSLTYPEKLLSRLNPVPFETIIYFHTLLTYRLPFSVYAQVLANLVGNIVLFIPFGYFLFGIKEKKRHSFLKVILISSLIIIIIEVSQMLSLRGYCDIDDLILNELGVAVGYLIRSIVVKRQTKKARL